MYVFSFVSVIAAADVNAWHHESVEPSLPLRLFPSPPHFFSVLRRCVYFTQPRHRFRSLSLCRPLDRSVGLSSPPHSQTWTFGIERSDHELRVDEKRI